MGAGCGTTSQDICCYIPSARACARAMHSIYTSTVNGNLVACSTSISRHAPTPCAQPATRKSGCKHSEWRIGMRTSTASGAWLERKQLHQELLSFLPAASSCSTCRVARVNSLREQRMRRMGTCLAALARRHGLRAASLLACARERAAIACQHASAPHLLMRCTSCMRWSMNLVSLMGSQPPPPFLRSPAPGAPSAGAHLRSEQGVAQVAQAQL